MPVITLVTKIKSEIEICFDLSRSIDLHQISVSQTKEKAIDGVTSGLIGDDETVTWEAFHFGIKQKLVSKITAFERPHHFRDEQVRGAFECFKHDHKFRVENEYVIMEDVFDFESPYGIFGKLFDKLILTNYMRRFLEERNKIIREYAESSKWKEILSG